MLSKKLSILLLTIFPLIYGFRQTTEIWSLEDCISYAIENNIDIRQMRLSEEMSQNQLNQSKIDLLPTINATAQHGFNFSNSIDPLTYEFVNQNTQSSSGSLNANLIVFNGLRKLRTIQSSKLNLLAQEASTKELQEITALNVANLYLQIMMAKEGLLVAQKAKERTENRLQRVSALIDAGVIPAGDLLDAEAQLANDRLQFIQAENLLESAKMNLKLLLQLDPFVSIDVIEPETFDKDLNEDVASYDPYAISNTALQTNASVKRAEFELLRAEKDWSLAKANLSPELSVFGTLRSTYFSESRQLASNATPLFPEIGVTSANETVTSLIPQFDASQFEKTSFNTQIQDNLSQVVGVSLNIPILLGWQRINGIQNAKLNQEIADLGLVKTKQDLKREVYTAWLDARAAQKEYLANEQSVVAIQNAYDFADQKYQLGAINAYDLNDAKNNLDVALANRIRAKYQFLFRMKVLAFYTGKPLTN